MQPFFFGPREERLFGIREQVQAPVRNTAVLICHSFGMEYMRSYRGLRAAARLLAGRSFDVMRFDYSCSGDSYGGSSDARADQWIADIRLAAQELAAQSGLERLCVVGLRLGALLAAEAVRGGLHCERLVLWDPPASGSAYIHEQMVPHEAWDAYKNRYRTRATRLPPRDNDELLGHAWPPAMEQSLSTLSLRLPADIPASILISAGSPRPQGLVAEIVDLPEAARWHEPAWIKTPWQPLASLEVFAQCMSRWLA